MNENNKLQKLKKTAGIAYQVINVVLVIIIVAVLTIVGLAAWTGIRGELPGGFHLAINALELTMTGVEIAFALLLFAGKGIIYLAVLLSTRQILREVAIGGTPFEQIQIRRMKRISILILVGSVINFMSIQIGEWVIALVVWLLAMVFDYGCVLQQESDETL